jgi:[FeFe] hydrogenase H-cluster maturation GTPase HydF
MNISGFPKQRHIVFIGRDDTGKSALINALAGRDASIAKDVPEAKGNKTKKMIELSPYGAAALVDTAGIEDENDFGKKRISKTLKAIAEADVAVVVLDAREKLTKEEIELFVFLNKIKLPFVIAVNKIEFGINPELLKDIEELKVVHFEISIKEDAGLDVFRSRLIRLLPEDKEIPLVNNLVKQGDIVLCVVPANSGIKEEQLIHQQIQTMREALDKQAVLVVTRINELKTVLSKLSGGPDLVITDSRIIRDVLKEIPDNLRLTTFAILYARQKGSLSMFIEGLKYVNKLKDGDKVLIAEACTEHPLGDDLGRVKIPTWLKEYTEKNLEFDIKSGADLPENLSSYNLIIHCAGCRLAREAMLSRLKLAALLDIPVVNYGILVSYIHGAIPRALLPFEEAINIYNNY